MEYTRQSRQMSDEQKDKISKALTGRPKPQEWRDAISKGLKDYWGNDSNFPHDLHGKPVETLW